MRRILQVSGWTLIWSGLFVFGFLGWQLWGTDVVNAGVQAEAKAELEQVLETREVSLPAPEVVEPTGLPESEDLPPDVSGEVFYQPQDDPEIGSAFAFLRIPKIGLDTVLFDGVDAATLRKGPGHMPGTPLPGHPGNSVLSGHRTTYGRPFFDLDLLEVGDTIEIESEVGIHIYEVREIRIVLPTDFWVTYDRSGAWLTLTTCHPKFSARERLIVWAEMVSGPNFEFSQLHEAQVFEESA